MTICAVREQDAKKTPAFSKTICLTFLSLCGIVFFTDCTVGVAQ